MRLHPLPAFDDNYIWTLADAGGRALVVDPGQAEPVLAAAADGLVPAAILLTHHHGDHIGGVETLLAQWPDLPVFAPHDARIPMATHRVGDGEQVAIEGWQLDVIAVPAHTSSHLAYHGHGVLFSGDTLFSLGCGRLFEGTPAQLLAAMDRLSTLPDDTLVCCAHEYTLSNAAFACAVDPGNAALARRRDQAVAQRAAGAPTLPVRLAEELACNPFLRIDDAAVRAAVRSHAAHAGIAVDDDRATLIGVLRQWKDGFRG